MKGTCDFTKEVEYQIQIGNKCFPEYPVRSINQAFFEIQKALGIAGSAFHSISPTRAQYQRAHFIIAVDCEKVIEAAFTGINTKANDLLMIRVKTANGYTGLFFSATKMYTVLHTDNILEIRQTGVNVTW